MDKTDQIRQRAHQIWEASGHPEGQAADHWQQAEAELVGPDTSDTVRVAGPSEMRDPPRRWSDADELSDESFPASDPPGTY